MYMVFVTLALSALLTGIMLGTPPTIMLADFENVCLMFVYQYVCFVFAKWLVLWVELTKGLSYEKSLDDEVMLNVLRCQLTY